MNLLAVLAVLVEERGVSAAAERLSLSQSATSHALQRLRKLLNDELLTRDGSSMRPTPVAMRLLDAVRPALEQIAAALNERETFDPATSTRTFVLRISEYLAPTLLAPLYTLLRRIAPEVRLVVLPIGTPEMRGIEPGEIHIRAERGRRNSARPTSRTLFEDEFAVMMSASHPAAGDVMTLDRYVSLRHLKVTADAVGTNMIDEALGRLGLSRDVIMSVPSWFEIRRVVAETDMIAAVPRHWMMDPTLIAGCVCHQLPVSGVVLSVDLTWHPSGANDGGEVWLRDMLARLLKTQTEAGA
ncbi:MAG: LysR family transcriptional regulator [Janthinobacterium lividum]